MELNTTAFKAWKDANFPDNTIGAITELVERNFGEHIADSFFNKQSDAYNGAKGFQPSITTIAGLKAIATTGLAFGVNVAFRDSGEFDAFRQYELTNSIAAEVSPNFIRPDDYNGTTNTKVWRQVKLFPRFTVPTISTITGLKAILTAGVSGLPAGTYITFADSDASDVLRTYKLTTGTTAESSPNVIRPDDYAASTNEKVWLLVQQSIDGGTP